MKISLQKKVDLIKQNSKIVQNSAKLDFTQAANLGALLFTAQNVVADEATIRENRRILKRRAGIFNNLRGPAANLSILCRMSLNSNPEVFLGKVLESYEYVKQGKILRGEAMVFAATAIADSTPTDQYARVAQEAWATLHKMRTLHPLITSQEDLTLAYLLNKSGANVEELLDEAEKIYAFLKPTGFKLKKDTLQTISIVLALSEKPMEEKCEKFMQLRNALRDAGHRIYGMELAVLSAFVDIEAPIEQIAAEIIEVDNALKRVRGFGPLLCGGNLRRLYASALVLQTYTDNVNATASRSVTETVVTDIINQIITVIIITTVIATTYMSSAS